MPEPIAMPIDYTRAGWCETCREAYAPPREWRDSGGTIMAVRVWCIRHNLLRHPRRSASRRLPQARHHHNGRTDCR